MIGIRARAVTALITSAIAVGLASAPIATAAFDSAAFDKCVDAIPSGDTDWDFKYFKCCQDNGGVPKQENGFKGCMTPEEFENPPSNGAPSPKNVPTVQRVPDVGASLPPATTAPTVPGPVRPRSVG